ncbi:hypothetical protein C7120_07480 [Prevotella sp. oral taxon 376]|uniref:hypothetical protein n=1 Tax=Prevotella sp. oral taxon 376 TaxID=712466 RepID=UPI000D1DE257|nr:hypothetical protein [Prevotella sp. oral taxon 376]PTL34361.1 hypothetical protein C7120_07480 [Prevotella sp. oral taxon 376]
MKQNQVEQRLYDKPEIEVIGIEPHRCLLELSGPGGHNGAGGDGNDLNAKQGWFDEIESNDN